MCNFFNFLWHLLTYLPKCVKPKGPKSTDNDCIRADSKDPLFMSDDPPFEPYKIPSSIQFWCLHQDNIILENEWICSVEILPYMYIIFTFFSWTNSEN